MSEDLDRLNSVQWLHRYATGLHDLVNEFYVPALSRSVEYVRKAGFFSSTALAVAAKGVARLLARGGRMRLLVGARLSADDAEAIAKGYREREEVIAEALQRTWAPPEDEIVQDRLAVVAEMVARGLLDIRVVVPVDSDGKPLAGENGEAMFHEKSGVFTDAAGDQVAFAGSINETATGWQENIEQVLVFCSWREEGDYVRTLLEDFERMWAGEHPRALVVPFPEALRRRLLELRPEEPSIYDPEEEAAVAERQIAEERERWIFQFLRDAPLLENGEALVEAFAAVEPWPHQRTVYKRVCRDYPGRWYMLCDEVGLGKTIEAGFVLRTLLLTGRVRRVLILVPKHLIRQWQEELREKFNVWAYHYDGRLFVDPVGVRYQCEAGANPWDSDYPVIIASAHLAKRRGRMETLLEAQEWNLVVVDEAHHARRAWGPGENRPNRMLRLLDELRKRTRCLLLLTATPMQIDVRELWDLLRIVGMKGRWASAQGELFQRYFLALQRQEWRPEDLRFLLSMLQEYFANGGEADEALRQEMQRQGAFVLWGELTNPKRPAEAGPVAEALRSPDRRPLVQAMLQRHTPVRQFLFRYTRETLRRYVRQGLLSANVPTREVEDRFIDLGPARRLYDRVEEYISQHYQKAQREQRRGLGYVMTVYRQRLTSSPWAVSETLRRHKERLEARLEGVDSGQLVEELFDEDPSDLDLAEDAVEAALGGGEHDVAAVLEEIREVEDFLAELRTFGPDPKLRQLVEDLRRFSAQHPRSVVFTQYTDTMDFLRDELVMAYGPKVACYSGRGGEVWDPTSAKWLPATKDDIKSGFFDGRYLVLVCTEAASEGLNLQASDLLINYDMPWNPMRVEQRIGRIDRIGQQKPKVFVLNYYYEGSVEAEIYQVLRQRVKLFEVAVGPLQPVLGRVPKRIEKAAMTPVKDKLQALEEERRGIEEDIHEAEQHPVSVDDLARADPPSGLCVVPPCKPADLREVVLTSKLVGQGWLIREDRAGVWEIVDRHTSEKPVAPVQVSFRQDVLAEQPARIRHCLSWGDPLFRTILQAVPAPRNNRWGPLERRSVPGEPVHYLWHGPGGSQPIRNLRELRAYLERITTSSQ